MIYEFDFIQVATARDSLFKHNSPLTHSQQLGE